MRRSFAASWCACSVSRSRWPLSADPDHLEDGVRVSVFGPSVCLRRRLIRPLISAFLCIDWGFLLLGRAGSRFSINCVVGLRLGLRRPLVSVDFLFSSWSLGWVLLVSHLLFGELVKRGWFVACCEGAKKRWV